MNPAWRTVLIFFLADFAATSLWALTSVRARWLSFAAATLALLVLVRSERAVSGVGRRLEDC
jgi:hypothetical protein